MRIYDLELDLGQWRQFDAEHGHGATMEAIAQKFHLRTGRDVQAFSMSLDWLQGDYALKIKGAEGDILVGWLPVRVGVPA